jgi:tungstate transport system substrate-binding protein
MRRVPAACLLAGAVLSAATAAQAATRTVTVTGPAALAESGFVRSVLVPVARRHGIAVRFVSSDGAGALRDVRAGKAQVALSDNAAAEAAFLASAGSLERTGRLVLYGDDVLVGPARDPAGVATRAPTDVAAALRLVAAAGAAGRSDFIAGGIGQDEPGLWQAAKVTRGEQAVPVGERWYHYGATDPAAVVRRAAACAYTSRACYALVDRAVFRRLQGRGGARGLRIVVARNTGGSAGTNAALAHPVRAFASKRAGPSARALLDLLSSPGLQAAIGRYPAPGKSAYHAAATPLVLLEHGIPDLKGRLTEGTPGGNGLEGVRLRLLVERAGHRPVVLATTRTDAEGGFTVSVRVDAGRNLRGTLVLHSDPVPGQSAGAFTIGRMG